VASNAATNAKPKDARDRDAVLREQPGERNINAVSDKVAIIAAAPCSGQLR
jgi:hypothetical protein